jgi:hypothetical protein
LVNLLQREEVSDADIAGTAGLDAPVIVVVVVVVVAARLTWPWMDLGMYGGPAAHCCRPTGDSEAWGEGREGGRNTDRHTW